MQIQERAGIVTMKGEQVTLLGPDLQTGAAAPDFRVVDQAFEPIKLSDFKGRACLISVVPSLDTGVCALQTKRFNDEVAKLPDDVVMMTVSMDLPFAQKRFCEAEKIDRIQILSDSVWREFGLRYGVLIKDMGLLARSIFIVDRQGNIAYKEIVADISSQPDYDTALNIIRKTGAER